jgi:signal recognition particle receptor subunit beta
MVLINHTSKEMIAKIVYYGPARSGKTTNLIKIYEFLPSGKKGKMLSLATKQDRTLFFDLLPVESGKIKNFNLRFQLYTVPGQVYYNETRKLVLKGADAVVFVVDSQKPLLEENRDSFKNLFDNLKENDIDPKNVPIFIQYNKRDCPSALPLEFLKKELALSKYPYNEAVAIKGEGVMETYKEIVKLLIKKLKGEEEPIKIKEKKEEEKRLEDTHPNLEEVPIKVEEAPSYDKVEEVNLEKLIDERQRPTVVFIPPDEKIEELSPEYIVEEPEVTVEDTVIQIAPSKEEEEEILPTEKINLSEFKKDLNDILEGIEKIKEKIKILLEKIK